MTRCHTPQRTLSGVVMLCCFQPAPQPSSSPPATTRDGRTTWHRSPCTSSDMRGVLTCFFGSLTDSINLPVLFCPGSSAQLANTPRDRCIISWYLRSLLEAPAIISFLCLDLAVILQLPLPLVLVLLLLRRGHRSARAVHPIPICHNVSIDHVSWAHRGIS